MKFPHGKRFTDNYRYKNNTYENNILPAAFIAIAIFITGMQRLCHGAA